MGSKSSRQIQIQNNNLKNDILNLLSELNTKDLTDEKTTKSLMMRFDILLVRWRKQHYLYLTRIEGYNQIDAQRRLRQISPKFFLHTEPGMEPPRYCETDIDIEPEPKLTILDLFQERHMSIIKFFEHIISNY